MEAIVPYSFLKPARWKHVYFCTLPVETGFSLAIIGANRPLVLWFLAIEDRLNLAATILLKTVMA